MDVKPNPTTEEVLDPEDLTGIDARDLQFLLMSRAYQNFYEPLLVGIMQRWLAQLADPSLTRKWNRPDDYLRGGIAVARAVLNAPRAIIDQQNQRSKEEAHEETLDEHYGRIAREGRGLSAENQPGLSPSDPI